MNTQEKYYTPDISEFHVGFEFESYSDIDGWKDSVLSFPYIPFLQQTKIGEFVVPNWIRVKHLDREDIESLGWKFQGKNSYMFDEKYWLIFKSNNERISIEESDGIGDFRDSEFLFQGKLKNKSELKRLMGQLGIL